MAISRIGQATAQASTITIPGTYAAGDLIIVVAARANTTAPTVPSGWVTLSTTGGSNLSFVGACKYAQSASESSPTFSNAGILLCAVYRSSLGVIFPGLAINTGSGTSATITYNGLTNYRTGLDANWYLSAVVQLTTANALETAPSGMANVNTDSITGLEAALHDTNGNQASNLSSATVVLANSAFFRSLSLQISEMAYTFPSGGGGIFFRPGMSGGMSE